MHEFQKSSNFLLQQQLLKQHSLWIAVLTNLKICVLWTINRECAHVFLPLGMLYDGDNTTWCLYLSRCFLLHSRSSWDHGHLHFLWVHCQLNNTAGQLASSLIFTPTAVSTTNLTVSCENPYNPTISGTAILAITHAGIIVIVYYLH